MVRKSYFSLIEIMIVIFILGAVSSLVSIKISKTISEYRYTRASKQIESKFLLARRLALANQRDVTVVLSQEKTKVYCDMGFDEIASNERKICSTQSFPNIYLRFSNIDNDNMGDCLKFTFTPSGNFYPKGELIISPTKTSEKKQDIHLDLSKDYLKETQKDD